MNVRHIHVTGQLKAALLNGVRRLKARGVLGVNGWGNKMYDTNECKFSGKVESFKRVKTRTGTPMISFKLKCWKEIIKVVAFQELAESTTLTDGDRVEVVGKLQSSNFEFEDRKYNSFQIVAESVGAESIVPKRENKTEPKYAEHGQRPVADFERMPF